MHFFLSGNYVLPESPRYGEVNQQLNKPADETQKQSSASEILMGIVQFQEQDFDTRSDISDISGLVSASQVSVSSLDVVYDSTLDFTYDTSLNIASSGCPKFPGTCCKQLSAKIEKEKDKRRNDRERNGTAVQNTAGVPFGR